MNIVLATDDNFVQHCCVTIASVLKHNTDVVFYVFTEGLSEKNEIIIRNLVQTLGGVLHVCLIDSEIVCKFPMPTHADAHISIATYYRLMAEFVLPKSVTKIIYMDCDMVVRNSLDTLWNENIETYAMGAVFQPVIESQERDKVRLQIPSDYGYFNAGLLLINLKYWRKHSVTNRLLGFIKNHYSQIKQHDQDVLNAVLYREVKPISFTWNFLPVFLNFRKLNFKEYVGYKDNVGYPVVIHYVSAPKPWDIGCQHPYKSEYYKYLRFTPFCDFTPKFIWKKYYKNVLRHKLIRICILIDVLNLRKLVKRS